MEPELKSQETIPPRSSGTKPNNSNFNSNSSSDSKSQPNSSNDSESSTEQKPDLSKVDPKLLLELATPTQTKRKNPHTPAIICAVLLVALVALAAFLAFGGTLQNMRAQGNNSSYTTPSDS